jgi:hypothetical protein
MLKIPKVNKMFIPTAWASEAQLIFFLYALELHFIFTNANLPWQKPQTQTFSTITFTKVAPDNAIPVRILICALHFVVCTRSNWRENPGSIVFRRNTARHSPLRR